MKIVAMHPYVTHASDMHSKMSPSARLAQHVQQKWMALHPQDTLSNGGNLDDSLTSLGWLQNLKVSEFTQPSQSSSQGFGLNNNRNFIKQEPQTSPQHVTSLQTAFFEPRLQVGDTAPSYVTPRSSFDQKTNPYMKPPYSYTSLICMAMQATRKNKITLSCIYNWIKENFLYYRLTDPSWQNSIRHNLSLNKCFEKVARQKDEPGKGGFWRINPEYGNLVENGAFKKRQGSWNSVVSPPLKRSKLNDNTSRVSGMKSGARDDKLLSNGYSSLDMDDVDDENSLTLREDLNWMSVLNQDMKSSGRAVNGADVQAASDDSLFMAMSPPSSETNSDDLGLELFSQADFSMGFPLDFHTNDPLDLTVQGTTIRRPGWWSGDGINNFVNMNNNYNNKNSLITPVTPPPEVAHGDSVWGEGLELGPSSNNFDLDLLFEFDNITSPK